MTSENTILLAAIDAVCERIVNSEGDVPENYLIPWRGDKGEALCVVAPQNISEVQALIGVAKKHHLNLVAQGARTGLVGGSVPLVGEKLAVIVSMEHFRSRCEFNEIEQTITVDAGFHLSEVNEMLGSHGMCVPVNVSSDPMVGAMAATNIAGSRVVRYGDFRQLCCGIEVVTADKTASVYSTLTRPRKDNSTLNFTQLFIGSFGSCGIITTVVLRVVPMIPHTETVWLSLTNGANISGLIQRIEQGSGDTLLACELISREALNALKNSEEQVSSTDLVPFAEDEGDVVFVEWGSDHAEIDVSAIAEKVVTQLIESSIASDAQFVPSRTSWNLRHRVSEAVQTLGTLVGCDISVTRDQFSQLRTQCRDAVRSINPDYVICDFGHVGDGGVHMNIVIPHGTEVDTQALRSQVAAIVSGLGGSFSAEHGLGSFNTAIYEKYADPTARKLAQSFKKTCDPEGILGHSGIHL